MSTLGTYAGVDIGGTKCAVSIGEETTAGIQILAKKSFPTPSSPELALKQLLDTLQEIITETSSTVLGIGISCGGPLDSRRGLILAPPNLPTWDGIDVITPFQQSFGVPVGLQNDANACALAEWKWGAGKGCRNMIFLTFGTGMGAGLILDGRLYAGTNDMAGEVGHMRMEEDGPTGYGKPGSFEGFCSGGGIAQLARSMAEKSLRAGDSPLFCPVYEDLAKVTAQKVGEAAQQGDALAIEVLHITARQLGRGLAILIDVLNPERIVIGSIYGRQLAFLEPIVKQVLLEETLPHSLSVCTVVPAGLGESVGDLASLSVALHTVSFQ
ncbi:ROK family protein [Paenibacillus eucommiae]|uniref:Glucokinase n=1 Tax=Paenibacillus eucommiae TaxID=1355755 RepID=A0ABS4J2D3_9BACL|nr:ROK family protein [Paenibacillus eucommiae]MBP1993998.1 glucokinase [Paenibacillus eucommiae]